MNQKYQIFISSTFEDLRSERDQVVRAMLEMGHIPVGMEMFSAADEEQWKIISRQITLSDYYVVIIAHRYGSTDDGISYTEKEYDFAVKSGVPVLAFVIFDDAPWPSDLMERDVGPQQALSRFKEKARKRYVTFWSNAQDLYGAVPIALMKQMNTNPRVGWIRANEVAGPEATTELARLSRENAELRAKIAEMLTQAADEEETERERRIQALRKNEVQLAFWYEGAEDWSDSKKVTLYEIFRILAPDLMVEKSTVDAMNFLGRMLRLGKKELRTNFPIPRNVFQSILADLATLDIVEPSKRRHLAKDTNEYWTLTEMGKELLHKIRRSRLEAGVGEAEEASKRPPTSGSADVDTVAPPNKALELSTNS